MSLSHLLPVWLPNHHFLSSLHKGDASPKSAACTPRSAGARRGASTRWHPQKRGFRCVLSPIPAAPVHSNGQRLSALLRARTWDVPSAASRCCGARREAGGQTPSTLPKGPPACGDIPCSHPNLHHRIPFPGDLGLLCNKGARNFSTQLEGAPRASSMGGGKRRRGGGQNALPLPLTAGSAGHSGDAPPAPPPFAPAELFLCPATPGHRHPPRSAGARPNRRRPAAPGAAPAPAAPRGARRGGLWGAQPAPAGAGWGAGPDPGGRQRGGGGPCTAPRRTRGAGAGAGASRARRAHGAAEPPAETGSSRYIKGCERAQSSRRRGQREQQRPEAGGQRGRLLLSPPPRVGRWVARPPWLWAAPKSRRSTQRRPVSGLPPGDSGGGGGFVRLFLLFVFF